MFARSASRRPTCSESLTDIYVPLPAVAVEALGKFRREADSPSGPVAGCASRVSPTTATEPARMVEAAEWFCRFPRILEGIQRIESLDPPDPLKTPGAGAKTGTIRRRLERRLEASAPRSTSDRRGPLSTGCCGVCRALLSRAKSSRAREYADRDAGTRCESRTRRRPPLGGLLNCGDTGRVMRAATGFTGSAECWDMTSITARDWTPRTSAA